MRRNSIEQDILYEDNHLIIINKKPGDIVQGDKTGDTPLSDIVKAYLKVKYQKPGEVFLGVIHRIDRPVSGAVVFAKTTKALTRMNAMLKSGEIHKTYWAVVKNRPPAEHDHLIHYLLRDEAKNRSVAYPNPREGSQKAELKYNLAGQSKSYYLLVVELLTGRHHQIRAQLAAIGCPIKGDLKYGYSRSNRDASIHLHAEKIRFVHPVTKQEITVVAPPAPDPIWDAFREIFQGL